MYDGGKKMENYAGNHYKIVNLLCNTRELISNTNFEKDKKKNTSPFPLKWDCPRIGEWSVEKRKG